MRATLTRSPSPRIRRAADKPPGAASTKPGPVLPARRACVCGGGCPRCGAAKPEPAIQRSALPVGTRDDPLERQADALAAAALGGAAPGAAAPAQGARVQRQDAEARDAGPAGAEAADTTEVDSPEPADASAEGGGAQGAEEIPAAPCDPQPLTRAQYLAHSGTSTNDFGLTVLSGTVTVPAVGTRRARGGVVLEQTAAAMPALDSVYTQAGTFTEGQGHFINNGDAGCPSGRYDLRWTITAEGAAKIRAGELEHCADLRHAFDTTLQRYADVVNGLATSGRVFPSQRAAIRYVTRQTGAAPDDWSAVFQCLARKTEDRDFMRWHTPRERTIPPSYRNSCAYARAIVHGSSFPHVGQHPTPDLIRDCGESGGTVPAPRRRRRLPVGKSAAAMAPVPLPEATGGLRLQRQAEDEAAPALTTEGCDRGHASMLASHLAHARTWVNQATPRVRAYAQPAARRSGSAEARPRASVCAKAFGRKGAVARPPAACVCGGGCPRCAGASKLAVSRPGDASERAADALAARAMNTPRGAAVVSGAPRHTNTAIRGSSAPFALGAGAPLGAAEREFFEPRFGADLSAVRVHTGERAAATAARLNARAFAWGPHVVFGGGEYQPETASGRPLLAHELAHVVSSPPGAIRRTAYSDCSAGEQPELEAAVSRAFSWLGTAYAMLREDPTPDRVRFALQLTFRNDSADVVERVKQVLTAIMGGLPTATLECENPGGAEYWWFCNVQEAQGFVRWTSVATRTGNIHVCMGPAIWGTLSDERRAHVVIHEAAHRFAGMSDEGYYTKDACLDSATTLGLAPGDLLDNADSYACFVDLALHHGEDALRGFLADRSGHTLTFTQSPPGDVDLRSGNEHDVWFTVGIPRGEGLTQLPAGFNTRFYLIDDAYNEFPMRSLAGPVVEFGTEGSVFIPAATRTQLIARGVRTGRVIAMVRLPQMTYLFEVRVNFRY